MSVYYLFIYKENTFLLDTYRRCYIVTVHIIRTNMFVLSHINRFLMHHTNCNNITLQGNIKTRIVCIVCTIQTKEEQVIANKNFSQQITLDVTSRIHFYSKCNTTSPYMSTFKSKIMFHIMVRLHTTIYLIGIIISVLGPY